MNNTAIRVYNTNEAAALCQLKRKEINSAIDQCIVRLSPGLPETHGGRPSRGLSETSLLQLKVIHQLGTLLNSERLQRLVAEIDANPQAQLVKVDEIVIIELNQVRMEIANAVRDLAHAEAVIVRDKAIMRGQPVFKGTCIPVRMIVDALARGASEDIILEAYPDLDRPMLAAGRTWLAANPLKGGPRSCLASPSLLSARKIKDPDPVRQPIAQPHEAPTTPLKKPGNITTAHAGAIRHWRQEPANQDSSAAA